VEYIMGQSVGLLLVPQVVVGGGHMEKYKEVVV
jgi:hypothetical protein